MLAGPGMPGCVDTAKNDPLYDMVGWRLQNAYTDEIFAQLHLKEDESSANVKRLFAAEQKRMKIVQEVFALEKLLNDIVKSVTDHTCDEAHRYAYVMAHLQMAGLLND